MEQLANGDVYMDGDGSAAKFAALWEQLTAGLVVEPAQLEVAGRTNSHELTCGGMLRETFANLCQKPLGAGDYLALAERFHTLFLEDVPVMQQSDRNAVKRFINLVDTLYDRGMMLIVRADARPSKLYTVEAGTEAFEFQRTVSRLREMQGPDWLKKAQAQ